MFDYIIFIHDRSQTRRTGLRQAPSYREDSSGYVWEPVIIGMQRQVARMLLQRCVPILYTPIGYNATCKP